MARDVHNSELESWEEHASALIAGKLRRSGSSSERRSSVQSFLRFWRFLLILSVLVLLYSIGSTIYEQQTGKSLLYLLSFGLLGSADVVQAPDLMSFETWKRVCQWLLGCGQVDRSIPCTFALSGQSHGPFRFCECDQALAVYEISFRGFKCQCPGRAGSFSL